jgi:Caspase domain
VDDLNDTEELMKKILETFNDDYDISLFYFSGHGDKDYLDYHLVMPDAKPYCKGIPMAQLMTIVNRSKAKNKVIILDCCHSAGVGVSHPYAGIAVSLLDGITIICASEADKPAYEKDNHGEFTTLLVEALKGGAADLNGNISPGGIYAFIDKAMGPDEQRPVFKTNISTFVSLRKAKPQVPEHIMQQLPILFESLNYYYPLDPSCEFTNNPNYKIEPVEPYTIEENKVRFQSLQKLHGVGLVVPVGADHMYFAAMNFKSCKLTPLGQHYWRLMQKLI